MDKKGWIVEENQSLNSLGKLEFKFSCKTNKESSSEIKKRMDNDKKENNWIVKEIRKRERQ